MSIDKALEFTPHALKEIVRIKSQAEARPVPLAEMAAKAVAADYSFPAELTTIVPHGWHVGYIVEQHKNPFGDDGENFWRRLRVSIAEQLPPADAVIEIMAKFEFECAPDACLWIPDGSVVEPTICVMEPLAGPLALEKFHRKMEIQEQIEIAKARDQA